MPWLYLIAAILFEVAGTVSMKLSDGLTRPWPTVGLFLAYGVAFVFLALALRTIGVGVAYAIWSAVGTAAIALIGIWAFGEAATWTKAFFIALIVIGVAGLSLTNARG
jgi:small multidrug resistance pump